MGFSGRLRLNWMPFLLPVIVVEEEDTSSLLDYSQIERVIKSARFLCEHHTGSSFKNVLPIDDFSDVIPDS